MAPGPGTVLGAPDAAAARSQATVEAIKAAKRQRRKAAAPASIVGSSGAAIPDAKFTPKMLLGY